MRTAEFVSRTDGRMDCRITTDMDYPMARLLLDVMLAQNEDSKYKEEPIAIKFEINASKIEKARKRAKEEQEYAESISSKKFEKPEEPTMF